MMGSADDAPTGLLLDRYRVEGTLGEGGLGIVVKAFDTRLKRMVAIKTLKRASYTADPDQFRMLEERFAREAEAGSRVGSHPNIVAVHDLVIDAEKTQYLILEYVAGGTLAERIERGAIPLADALRLAAEIAHGLHAAHETGLVHRDIKPANIFLTASAHAKVGDFGIAQIDNLSGRTRAVSGHPGTPLYMSPEQERLAAYLRPASDQYSLGLVAFEMITGQIYKRIGARRAAQLLAEQSAPVRDTIARMLADDPDDRYATIEEAARALHGVEQHASKQTEMPTRADGTVPFPPGDARELALTRHDTPPVALQPAPPVTIPPPPALRVPATHHTRRAFLIGAAGVVAGAAGVAGVTFANLRSGSTPIATATPAVLPTVAVVSLSEAITTPTTAPTTIPTATSVPTATAIAPTAAPIIITAPPIVITATPQPTLPPTPTPLPTAPPPPTATSLPTPTMPIATTRITSSGQTVTWVESQNRVLLSYPRGWSLVQVTDRNEIFEIDSGDGVHIDIYASPYTAEDTPMKDIIGYRDRQNRRTDRGYTFGTPYIGTLGGHAAAFVTFSSTNKTNQSDTRIGQAAYATSGGWTFLLEAFTDGPSWRHQDQVQAILQSIVFP